MYFATELGYLFHGDCRDVLKANQETWSQCVDLAFIDPPFNIDQEYDVHKDDMDPIQHLDLMTSIIKRTANTVRPMGIMCVHVPWYLLKGVYELMEWGAWQQIQHIIWHYRFGVWTDRKFISSHCHCLVFRRGSHQHTWNPGLIQVPSDRATVYGDPRSPTGTRVPFDVWSVENDGKFWGRVQGNSKERVDGHPNQLPELYLDRLIKAYTLPGDLVLDPTAGTGTTPTVAEALKRRWLAIELSEQYCKDIAQRVAEGAVRV